MKAAVLYELKTPLRVEDVDLDPPKAHEVRIKIVANGVCHSDWSVIHGVLRAPLPVVPGHEGAGIVEEVGPEVTLVKPGDHVVLSFAPYCGRCYYCGLGRPVLCDNMRVVMGQGTLSTARVALGRMDSRSTTWSGSPASRSTRSCRRSRASVSPTTCRSTGPASSAVA